MTRSEAGLVNANRLWLDVVESNERARSLYASVGFTEEGVLRESLRRDEGFASLVLMSILASEFVPPGIDA